MLLVTISSRRKNASKDDIAASNKKKCIEPVYENDFNFMGFVSKIIKQKESWKIVSGVYDQQSRCKTSSFTWPLVQFLSAEQHYQPEECHPMNTLIQSQPVPSQTINYQLDRSAKLKKPH